MKQQSIMLAECRDPWSDCFYPMQSLALL